MPFTNGAANGTQEDDNFGTRWQQQNGIWLRDAIPEVAYHSELGLAADEAPANVYVAKQIIDDVTATPAVYVWNANSAVYEKLSAGSGGLTQIASSPVGYFRANASPGGSVTFSATAKGAIILAHTGNNGAGNSTINSAYCTGSNVQQVALHRYGAGAEYSASGAIFAVESVTPGSTVTAGITTGGSTNAYQASCIVIELENSFNDMTPDWVAATGPVNVATFNVDVFAGGLVVGEASRRWYQGGAMSYFPNSFVPTHSGDQSIIGGWNVPDADGTQAISSNNGSASSVAAGIFCVASWAPGKFG